MPFFTASDRRPMVRLRAHFSGLLKEFCCPNSVLDILPNPNIGPFTKEGGEVVIDADGKRVLSTVRNFQKFQNSC